MILIGTSSKSGFLKEEIRIDELKSLKYGLCWIQDFSSFFPINNMNIKNIKKKNIDYVLQHQRKIFPNSFIGQKYNHE